HSCSGARSTQTLRVERANTSHAPRRALSCSSRLTRLPRTTTRRLVCRYKPQQRSKEVDHPPCCGSRRPSIRGGRARGVLRSHEFVASHASRGGCRREARKDARQVEAPSRPKASLPPQH